MSDLSRPLTGLRDSELWRFMIELFERYTQFAIAFMASSGFFSVFIYLALFHVNAISVIDTSDIVFNSVVNLILLLPVFVLLAWATVGVIALSNRRDAASAMVRIVLGAVTVAAILIVIAGLAWMIVPVTARQHLAATLLNHLPWLDGATACVLLKALFWCAIVVLGLWLFPLIYRRITVGILPKGFLTALIIFIFSNAIVGAAAHYLFLYSLHAGDADFMRGGALTVPAQVESQCPGRRDVIWTGDRALVFYCEASGRRFIYYRDFDTVVEAR